MSMRRVRFDTELASDESIPGALVKAVTSHVLHRTQAVLEAADIVTTRPGHVQLLDSDRLSRLAQVIRCDPAKLEAIRGQRIMTRDDGVTHQHVYFQELQMLRSHLELGKRRISPISLMTAEHHRLAWLNALLPYCPVTFEMLVDKCPHCHRHLGWRLTWGVGVCEHCEQAIPPSPEPLLPTHMRADYSFFARLCSPVPGEWETARAQLPQSLQSTGSATLIRLAMRIGFLTQTPMIENVRQYAAADLPRDVLTSVVVDGTRMLRTWPNGFLEWSRQRADDLRSDHKAFAGFRTILRRLVHAPVEGTELANLVIAAMPDLCLPFEHAFSGGQSIYLHNEAARKIGISCNKLRDVREAGLIEHVALPGPSRLRVQYPVPVIDRLTDLVRGTPVINQLPGKFGLPNYAIEQLVAHEILVRENDPAVNAIRETICIRPESVDELKRKLDEITPAEPTPASAIALRAAARRIGGRKKPWSHIIAALIEGSVPIWKTTDTFQARHWLVRPEDLIRFDSILATDTGDLGSAWINLDDLGELLNITPKMIQQVISDFSLKVVERSRADCIPFETALLIAGNMSTSAEVGARLGIHSRRAHHMMHNLDIIPASVGWSRRALVEHGLLSC